MLFQLEPDFALHAFQSLGHIVGTVQTLGFQFGPALEVGFALLGSPEVMQGQSSEIVHPRVFGARIDRFTEQVVRFAMIVGEECVNASAVYLLNHGVLRGGMTRDRRNKQP